MNDAHDTPTGGTGSGAAGDQVVRHRPMSGRLQSQQNRTR